MRTIIVIAFLTLVVASIAPRYLEKAGVSVQPAAQAAVPGRAPAQPQTVAAGPRSVVLSPGRGGHFYVDGTVDGRRIGFVVDTGATAVSLTQSDAARLGIHPAQRDYTVRTMTANGVGHAAPVRLDMVEIGGVTVRNVDAFVHPDAALSQNLLGMSFLSRLRRFEYREGRLVLEE
jgi:aspartyl protease family protein